MKRFITFCLIMTLALALPGALEAAVVGKIVQVEGQVDLLKQGKMPTVPAKAGDPLETGDVIRTKSGAKAQVRFVDDSTLTLSPGSRVAINEYLYNPEKKERHGIIQVFRGMVQAVATKLVETEKPNLIMETHTAVMGVRGTRWYAILSPTFTDVYNQEGALAVKNILPEVVGEVLLKTMQYTRVGANLAPTVPAAFTSDDLLMLQQRLSVGVSTTAAGEGEQVIVGAAAESRLSLASLAPVFNPMVNPINDPRTITFAVPPPIRTVIGPGPTVV